MIFQPGSGGSGGGLTVYTGTLSMGNQTVTFETPVKLVFVTNNNNYDDIPLWFIISPGGSEYIYGLKNDTWTPELIDMISLSADGKTLSVGRSIDCLYYALG